MTTIEPSATRGGAVQSAQLSRDGTAKSPEEIEAEINAARDNLARSLDVLADRTNPKNIAKRTGAKARGVFQSPDGSIKPVPIAIVAGVVVLWVVYRIRKARLD